MPQEILLREDRDNVAWLTLNRPDAYNALSLELMRRSLATPRSARLSLPARAAVSAPGTT